MNKPPAKKPKWKNGDTIRERIKELGWGTIRAFCEQYGIYPTNNFRSALNTGRFNQDMIEKTARGLGITLNEFLKLEAVICATRSKVD